MSIITVNSSNLSELKAFILGMQSANQIHAGPQLFGQPGYGYPSQGPAPAGAYGQGQPPGEPAAGLHHFPIGKAHPVKVTKGESDPSYSTTFPIYDGYRQEIEYDLVDGSLFTRD